MEKRKSQGNYEKTRGKLPPTTREQGDEDKKYGGCED